jgi:hypothetical protein
MGPDEGNPARRIIVAVAVRWVPLMHITVLVNRGGGINLLKYSRRPLSRPGLYLKAVVSIRIPQLGPRMS